MFRRGQNVVPAQTISSISRDSKTLLVAGGHQSPPQIEIFSATYGKPGEPEHLRDAKADVQNLIDSGELSFPVTRIAAAGGDPDVDVVKTLDVHYRINGQEQHLVLEDKEVADFNIHEEMPSARVEATPDGALQLCATKPGEYYCDAAVMVIPDVPEPVAIQGPWTVTFPNGWGAPGQIQLNHLVPLNEHPDPGVKYFSGTASYHCDFDVPAELLAADHRIELDLGDVAVMANVTLNGQPLGILWKSPFRLDVTTKLRAGQNTLEIAVANLWVNRLIGDQQLLPDSERNKTGTLKSWPQWLLDGKPSPTGRFTFTTHELWHKSDPLLDSGLIGPVQLRTIVCKRLGNS